MGWISVENMMPEVKGAGNNMCPDLKASVPVLVLDKYGDMIVAHYETDIDDETGEERKYWDTGKDVIYGITHWMPLPDPPEIDK